VGGSGLGGSGLGGSGGRAAGGAAAGGSSASGSGGSDAGGAAAGGSSAAGSGGMGSGGGSSGDVVPSAGCNVADGPDSLTVGGSSVSNGLPTSTKLSINSGGMNREYIVDIPENYDPAHPYRLIFSWHQAYGSAEGNANGLYPANNGPNFDAEHYAFFGLHRVATEANDPVIFVAPGGIGNLPWDYDRDVVLFDDLLALVTSKLCIDESRVFTTGFSFGAMMSYALSIGRASKLRGAVTMAAANYNFTQPTNAHTPIAYFGITGMSDGTCPWVNSDQGKTGGKYCVLSHAEDNGCTLPDNIQTATVGSNNHVCVDFEGCQEGYPVKVCTFDGNHTPSSISDGTPGDDGLKAFVPPLAWEFISQL
jgi:poly(3-hydroxybutyrate) depolymerase